MSTPHKTVNPRAAELNRVTPAARDAGLEKLKQLNHWLIAGAAGLTAALSLFIYQASFSHASSSTSNTAAAAALQPSSASGASVASPSVAAPQTSVAPSAVVTGAS